MPDACLRILRNGGAAGRGPQRTGTVAVEVEASGFNLNTSGIILMAGVRLEVIGVLY
jgi:hypothetical protein